MALQFPAGTPGATYVGGNGVTYTFDATAGVWTAAASGGGAVFPVNGPAFRATVGNGQTIVSNAASVKITFGAETFDTNSCFDLATSRFTPTTAGYYQVDGLFELVSTTSISTSQVVLIKNGASYGFGEAGDFPAGGNFYSAASLSDIISMNGTTDYIELFAYGLFSGTGFVNTARFSAAFVRPT